MKEPWFVASNRVDLSAAKALQLYGQRWGIETSFRDIKDYKFGMGMGEVRISNTARRDRLFLFSALAIVLLTLLGKAGDSAGLERTIKVNTSKTRTYSFFRQGRGSVRPLPILFQPGETALYCLRLRFHFETVQLTAFGYLHTNPTFPSLKSINLRPCFVATDQTWHVPG